MATPGDPNVRRAHPSPEGADGETSRHIRKLVVVAIIATVGLATIAVAGWSAWQDRQPTQRFADVVVHATEVPATQAACGPVLEEVVDASDHVDDQRIAYEAAPPAFGDHSSRWAYFARNFYYVVDRPEVAMLVHNLEHGYNILWYDETVVHDEAAVAQVKELAEEYAGRKRDPSTALIAAPWTSDDGGSFPPGKHFALTHWYADPDDPTPTRAEEIGYTRYCENLSGEIVQQWMLDYPLRASPEGFPANM